MSSGINNQLLIHVGVELVVIGGITFWLNKRISSADARVEEMADRIAALENVIGQQQQLLLKHEQILRSLVGAPPPTLASSAVPVSASARPAAVERARPVAAGSAAETISLIGDAMGAIFLNPKAPPTPPPSPPVDSDDEVPESELDALLAAELSSINSSSESPTIEIDCTPSSSAPSAQPTVKEGRGKKKPSPLRNARK